MSLGLIFLIVMQNFTAIRSAVLEKVTFDVAIFGDFTDSRTEIIISAVAYGWPDVTLRSGTSCGGTVLILFVSVKPEARRSFG